MSSAQPKGSSYERQYVSQERLTSRMPCTFMSMLDIGDKQNLGDMAAGIIYIHQQFLILALSEP